MFYGWRIVGVTFLAFFVSTGCTFYSFGVILKALAADLEVTRFTASLLLTAMQVMVAALGPLLGQAVDRGSARALMAGAAVSLAVGLLLASHATSFWHLILVYGTLLALGSATLGGLGSSTLLANWFVDQRGRALGTAQFGISFSGLVVAPVATVLVAAVGWRGTFRFYALAVVVVLLPAIWSIVRSRPEDLGLLPDGEVRGPARAPLPAPPPFGTRELLRNANFWLIAAAMSLNFFGTGAVLTHVYSHATDLGLAAREAATVLAGVTGLGAVGKLGFGWLVDRVDKRLALGLASALQGVGLLGILAAREYPLLFAAGCVFGLGMGGLVPLWGALLGAAFGRFVFGRAMGLMGPVILPLQVVGVPLAGWVFDSTGSYADAFRLFLGSYAAAVVVLAFLRLPGIEPGRSLPGEAC